jgi:folate-binding protein YgfZ
MADLTAGPTLSGERLERLLHRGVAVRSPAGLLELSGPGALTCLQGLLTSDVEKSGVGALAYGALLTPKGAIIVDLWAARLPDRFLLLGEPEAHDPAIAVFRRSLPPRLARVADRTGEWAALWLFGPALSRAGLPVPEPGRVLENDGLVIGRPAPGAPFGAVLAGPEAALSDALARLQTGGIETGDEVDREAARIIAGWPRLGREIDERTLVQEVRYDEIGGVSYTKGCFTGQETVARLHFRGHVNRELRGLVWEDSSMPREGAAVLQDGKEVGTVRSWLGLPDRGLGLALLRREVTAGARVVAAGREALVVKLPHDPIGLPGHD